ncbi:MAG: GNAT family N-acetyltransferase [Planctomycetes bacterium]|nr:GNAT family N-acetyltransferase [Planctomycetota bacterium]
MEESETRGEREADGISIGPIRDDEVPSVAAMHLGLATPEEIEAAVRSGGGGRRGAFRLYRDKVRFYAREERDGFLVAREDGRPVAFVIATANRRRLRRRMICGGYLCRWAAKAIVGRYGLGGGLLRRLGILRRPRAEGSAPHPGVDAEAPAPRRRLRPADARIESIVTLPACRRRGIASRLLAAADAYFISMGARRASLAVVKENLSAQMLYAHAGWRIAGEKVVSYGPAFVLERSLAPRRRVCHIITRMIPGGAQRVVSTLLRAGIAAGDEVILATGRDGGDEQVIDDLRATPILLEIVPSLVRAPHPWRDLCAARHLRRLLASHTPDIVHTHTSKAGILGRRAAARAGVPRIVHSSHGHPFAIHGRLAGAFYAFIERRAARWCDAIAVLSRDEREAFLARRVGSAGAYAVIGNGVASDAFDADPGHAREIRAGVPGPPDSPVAGTLCRLSFEKGLEDLLDAVTALRTPARLLVVGDGPLRGDLQARARALGIADRVLFAGHQEPPNDWLAAMDVFVLASRYEGFGMAALEAMAAGCPVMVTRAGGLPELVEDGRSGLLVPPRDARALAEALERLLADDDLRRRIGAAARDAARERTEARMVEAYFRLYGAES